MKQTIFHLLLFPFIITFFLSTAHQSNKADELIYKSIQYTRSLKDFEARFSYKHLNLSRRQTESKGVIRFKQSKYVLLTESSHIYFNLKNNWVYYPKYNQYMEVEIGPYGNKGVLSHMHSAFSSKVTREYLGLESVEGVQCHKILVKNTKGTLNYKQAYLWLSPKTLFPMKATFYDKTGGETIYQFTNLRPNLGISDQEFDFSPSRYPGANKIEGHD